MIDYKGVKRVSAVLPLMLAMGALGSAVQAQETVSRANSDATRVLINGQPISFSGQPPVEQNGRVLVPMRDIFEKLGAYVEYDGANQTVNAVQGGTRISLPIGGRTARVGDRNVTLDVPAQVRNGSTLVPLRFVAESLGARVDFDAGSDTVAIVTDSSVAPVTNAPPRRTAEERQRWEGRRDTTVVGKVIAVYSDTNPARIVVRTNTPGREAQDVTLRLPDDAKITRERPNGVNRPMDLHEITVGDSVAVLREAGGTVTAVNVQERANPASSTVFKGEFKESWRNGRSYMLKMVDGRQIEVPADVTIRANSQRIGIDKLRAGDRLTISVDPATGHGTRILVAP